MINVERKVARNRRFDGIFAIIGLISTLIGMITLAALILDLATAGLSRLSPNFFTSFPSRFPAQAGILSAWVGTCLIMLVTAATAVPMGVAAGVYLEEYAPKKLADRVNRDQHCEELGRGTVHSLWPDGPRIRSSISLSWDKAYSPPDSLLPC